MVASMGLSVVDILALGTLTLLEKVDDGDKMAFLMAGEKERFMMLRWMEGRSNENIIASTSITSCNFLWSWEPMISSCICSVVHQTNINQSINRIHSKKTPGKMALS